MEGEGVKALLRALPPWSGAHKAEHVFLLLSSRWLTAAGETRDWAGDASTRTQLRRALNALPALFQREEGAAAPFRRSSPRGSAFRAAALRVRHGGPGSLETRKGGCVPGGQGAGGGMGRHPGAAVAPHGQSESWGSAQHAL